MRRTRDLTTHAGSNTRSKGHRSGAGRQLSRPAVVSGRSSGTEALGFALAHPQPKLPEPGAREGGFVPTKRHTSRHRRVPVDGGLRSSAPGARRQQPLPGFWVNTPFKEAQLLGAAPGLGGQHAAGAGRGKPGTSLRGVRPASHAPQHDPRLLDVVRRVLATGAANGREAPSSSLGTDARMGAAATRLLTMALGDSSSTPGSTSSLARGLGIARKEPPMVSLPT